MGVFRKINTFWGMKIWWIFLGVITELDYIQKLFMCNIRSFFKPIIQNGDIFLVAKISNIFGGA